MENNYIQIQGWMVTDLNLSGNNLLVFAIIYGFSQDGKSKFTGSLNYLQRWLNCSRPTVIKSLKYLTENGYVKKYSTKKNNITYNSYKTIVKIGSKETLPGVVKNLNKGSKETLQGGSKETLPNNTIINNTNYNAEEQKADEIFKQYSENYTMYANQFYKDQIRVEALYRDILKHQNTYIQQKTLLDYLRKFVNHIKLHKKVHQNYKDFSTHFAYWLNRQEIQFYSVTEIKPDQH